MDIRIASLFRLTSAIMLSLALAFGGSVALADNDDDDDDDSGSQGEPSAYLYEGTVAELDAAKVVDEIDDLDDEDDDDDNDWDKISNGQDRPDGLLTTEDDLDDDHNITIDMLVSGDYMIVVHAGESTDTPILAAGNIDGEIQDGSVVIELSEIDASDYEGRASIHLDDDDDNDEDDDADDVEITVGIYPTGSVAPLGDDTADDNDD